MGEFQNKDWIVDVGELPGSSNNLQQVFDVTFSCDPVVIVM